MSFQTLANAVHVPAQRDRFAKNKMMIWGLIPLSIKISSKDTDGKLFLFEHADMAKGGPPRHVHHEQDEWFFVVKGEYAMEVGEAKYRLHAGDSLFAPRGIAHAWANVGDEPATMLTMVTPAGSFEDFIIETTEHATLPSPQDVAQAFADHAMTVVGPPLKVD